jgi:predicted NBD/HSP70 family sugar kinase
MMIAATKSNQSTSAAANRRMAMLLFRQHKTLSRIQLSQMTGLRGSTLTYIVREMLDKKLLRTAGRRESTLVGKKQILLEINPQLGHVLGIELRSQATYIVLHDASGAFLDELTLPGKPDLSTLPDTLYHAVQSWFAKRGTPPGDLLGLGLGIPGVVDTHRGIVLLSTPFQAANLPLADPLTQRFGAPTFLDHNVNLAALAEAQSGAAQNLTDFIAYTVNPTPTPTGVDFKSYGAAIYLRGELYRGTHYAAGELDIGMTPPDGLTGTLADLASLAAPDAPLSPFLESLARNVGFSIAHIANLLDPQAVILGGDQPITNHSFLTNVQAALDTRLLKIANRSIPIKQAALATRAVAQGAALAAADQARLTLAST